MDKQEILEALGPLVSADYPLAKLTSFKVGGPADFFATVRSESDFVSLVSRAWAIGLPVFIIGNGSNILMSDRGVRGLTIRNLCNRTDFSGNGSLHVQAQSGAMLPRVAHEAIKKGFHDLVYATGIPGTVGGAVMSNAGAYGWSMENNLTSVRFLARDGQVVTLPRADLRLSYRSSRFKETGEVVLAASLDLTRTEPAAASAELNRKRRETQPLTMPNAGSMFKNPERAPAGKLIQEAGLKGHRIGQAQISEKHANFIVNLGGASAADVLALIRLAQERVDEPLELEVQLAGDWS